MGKLIIEPSHTIPFVCFDSEAEKYEISGQSCLEEPTKVFDKITDWINENISKLDHSLNLILDVDYFNSASNRLLLKVLRVLEYHYKSGKDIYIIWFYEDDEIQNDGLIFEKLVSLPFNFEHKPEE